MRFKDKINDKINPEYYKKLAFIESSGNPNAQAKGSSAAGLYQFTEGTWNALVDKMGLDYTVKDRFDPKKSREVVEKFTKQNYRYLKNKLNREVTPSELYLAHFLGMGGSRSLLKAYEENPNISTSKILSDNQINANRAVFYNKDGSIKSVNDIYKWANKKFGITSSPKKEKGYDFFNDPDKLFDESNKKTFVDNPKTKEAHEKINKRKSEIGFFTNT